MAPFKFPINDWDGNGSTDDLYDIFMEKKICQNFESKKDENMFLDSSIVNGTDSAFTSDDEFSDSEFQSNNFNNFPNNSSSGNSNVWGNVFIIGVIMAIVGFIMNLD